MYNTKSFIPPILITALFTLVMFVSFPTDAAAQTVKATLPKFDVTINSYKIDNAYRKYPLLVYKDITYFPITFHDMQYVGLNSHWTAEEGLQLSVNTMYPLRSPYEYIFENQSKKNSQTLTATIATGPIKINGQTINNKNEKYPFLVFRNITYVPMTWTYGYKEFGWGYEFSSKTGLMIETKPGYSKVVLNEAKFEAIKVGKSTFKEVEKILQVSLTRDIPNIELIGHPYFEGRYYWSDYFSHFRFNLAFEPKNDFNPNSIVVSKSLGSDPAITRATKAIAQPAIQNKLVNGITYEHAVKIIGSKGTLFAEDLTTARYVWRYSDNGKTSRVELTFIKKDGKTSLSNKVVLPY